MTLRFGADSGEKEPEAEHETAVGQGGNDPRCDDHQCTQPNQDSAAGYVTVRGNL
jgi:hypothetical protein